MPIPDDERFEIHLKEFRPLVPAPLALPEGSGRRWPSQSWTWAGAVAAVLILGGLMLYLSPTRPAGRKPTPETMTAGPVAPPVPLTLRRANALLATSPSLKAAVNRIAFSSGRSPLPAGKQSALEVLSREEFKP